MWGRHLGPEVMGPPSWTGSDVKNSIVAPILLTCIFCLVLVQPRKTENLPDIPENLLTKTEASTQRKKQPKTKFALYVIAWIRRYWLVLVCCVLPEFSVNNILFKYKVHRDTTDTSYIQYNTFERDTEISLRLV